MPSCFHATYIRMYSPLQSESRHNWNTNVIVLVNAYYAALHYLRLYTVTLDFCYIYILKLDIVFISYLLSSFACSAISSNGSYCNRSWCCGEKYQDCAHSCCMVILWCKMWYLRLELDLKSIKALNISVSSLGIAL